MWCNRFTRSLYNVGVKIIIDIAFVVLGKWTFIKNIDVYVDPKDLLVTMETKFKILSFLYF